MRSTRVPAGEAVQAAGAGIAALVSAVEAGELRGESHQQLSELLRTAGALQARLEFVKLAAVREVDVRGSFTDDAALSAGAWVRMHARLTPGAACRAVRTARVLGSGLLPGTAAALAAGEIGPAHVSAIAAAVEEAPPGAVELIEPEALEVARAGDPRAVIALMRRFIHALDPDGADERALARYERRGLTLSSLPDGRVHISGLADEVTGSVLATAIDAASPLVPGDRRSAAQRRLDGLGDIARRYLADPDAPRTGGGAHPQVIVTLDADTLQDSHRTRTDDRPASRCDDIGREPRGTRRSDAAGDAAGPGGTLSWIGPIAGSTARRVACDADVTVVLIDRHGRVTAEQRQRRFFTPAQRRAIIARDGDRCAVPFCDRPVAWADAHHLTGWAHGGPTSVDNGALPCAAHHTVLHEGGWTLQRLPDGRYLITDRHGRQIGPEPHPPGHHRPTPHPRH